MTKRQHRPPPSTTLRLRWRCPSCNAVPAVQVFPDEVARYIAEEPEKLVISIQCQRCKKIYEVPAKAFQQAS